MYKKENVDAVIYKELSYQIVGCVFAVYNELGYGFKERYYEDAITKEFKSQNINFKRQLPYKVSYKGETIGTYRFDFLVEDKIIVELKKEIFIQKET